MDNCHVFRIRKDITFEKLAGECPLLSSYRIHYSPYPIYLPSVYRMADASQSQTADEMEETDLTLVAE
jgi:hypothetical protein